MMGYYGSVMGGWSWGAMGLFMFVVQVELVVIGALLIAYLWKKVK